MWENRASVAMVLTLFFWDNLVLSQKGIQTDSTGLSLINDNYNKLKIINSHREFDKSLSKFVLVGALQADGLALLGKVITADAQALCVNRILPDMALIIYDRCVIIFN